MMLTIAMANRNSAETLVPMMPPTAFIEFEAPGHGRGGEGHGDRQRDDDGRVAERKEEADADRTLALLHQLARDVVDRGDMVGVHRVAQAECVGQQRRAQAGPASSCRTASAHTQTRTFAPIRKRIDANQTASQTRVAVGQNAEEIAKHEPSHADDGKSADRGLPERHMK